MVDYDSARQTVQDPDADPAYLARIAYENPDFDALVANHRRAYPGLLAWLAQFGTPEAKSVLKMRTDLPKAVSDLLAANDSKPVDGHAHHQLSGQQAQVVPQAVPAAVPQTVGDAVADASGDSGSADHETHESPDTVASSDALPDEGPSAASPASGSPVTGGTEREAHGESGSASPQDGTEPAPSEVPGDQMPQSASLPDAQPETGTAAEPSSEPSAAQGNASADVEPPASEPLTSEPLASDAQPEPEQTPAADLSPAADLESAPGAQPQETGSPAPAPSDPLEGLLAEAGFSLEESIHGHTAREAMDPNTTWMQQHDIAVDSPELRPFLALNPNSYPELLDWLRSIGDPLIDKAFAMRGRN